MRLLRFTIAKNPSLEQIILNVIHILDDDLLRLRLHMKAIWIDMQQLQRIVNQRRPGRN